MSLCSYEICTHFSKKTRVHLSYTCAHKSGAFALSFDVTFARIFSQLFLGQLLVFYKSNIKAMNRNWSKQKANPGLKTKTGNE